MFIKLTFQSLVLFTAISLIEAAYAQKQGGGLFETSPKKKITTPSPGNKSHGLPNLIRLTEKGRWGSFSVQLRKSGRYTYSGKYNHGFLTTYTVVKFGNTNIHFRRKDTQAIGAVKGDYIGRRISDNSASGTAKLSNGSKNVIWQMNW